MTDPTTEDPQNLSKSFRDLQPQGGLVEVQRLKTRRCTNSDSPSPSSVKLNPRRVPRILPRCRSDGDRMWLRALSVCHGMDFAAGAGLESAEEEEEEEKEEGGQEKMEPPRKAGAICRDAPGSSSHVPRFDTSPSG